MRSKRCYDLKGNLERKKDIIFKLSNEIEPLKKKINTTTYKGLMDDTTFLLNNMNIRHNNTEGKNKNELIISMTNEELEKWYDKIYECILSIFVIKDYLNNRGEIERLRKNIKIDILIEEIVMVVEKDKLNREKYIQEQLELFDFE